MKAAELTVDQRNTEKGAVLTVAGELDLTTVPLAREALLGLVTSEQMSSVIVDLSQVEFIDSAGLALLVEARKRLAANSRLLYVILSKGQQPERVLHLVRFDTIMKLVYSLDEVTATPVGKD